MESGDPLALGPDLHPLGLENGRADDQEGEEGDRPRGERQPTRPVLGRRPRRGDLRVGFRTTRPLFGRFEVGRDRPRHDPGISGTVGAPGRQARRREPDELTVGPAGPEAGRGVGEVARAARRSTSFRVPSKAAVRSGPRRGSHRGRRRRTARRGPRPRPAPAPGPCRPASPGPTRPPSEAPVVSPTAAIVDSPSEAPRRPALVSSATPPRARTLARPQSITWTSPKAPTMTLAGFRSRWITPRACA